MLRKLLVDLSHEDNNPLIEDANQAMLQTIQLLQEEMNVSEDPTHDLRKIEVWTRGLIFSLSELEQSYVAAAFFRRSIKMGFMDDMTTQEQMDYARYVYFYKNGFIRVLSVLDKLGTVLNEQYNLQTAKVKAQYSYFSVMRQLTLYKQHNSLSEQLSEIKDYYREPINILRKRRNAEIHYMNTEMEDDLWQRHQGLHDKIVLEDVDKHLLELKLGMDMICKSLSAAYHYIHDQWHNKTLNANSNST
ncbi:Cthe_2314 family HEPN domain-containing protein [Paenibacillus sp. IHBB 10380]|uniref:Cthe_2314 family HEPN domain-containing protein n=1 Tax=Paenibacillus sp. IHBB 10380 TaxID=1566358 RepID=UPI0005CFE0CE|nr:Cthe_2314 family HEPN domain-containing protein [Paenibacillus sp. IHBB 10380]AJS57405.1 bacterial nucleoid DNA-binding protein [Paenibacillus sp. IHBB 10380]